MREQPRARANDRHEAFDDDDLRLVHRRPAAVDSRQLLDLLRGLGGLPVQLWIRATGSSMEPAIPSGACVLLALRRPVHLGDIVLRDVRGVPVLHRVVRRHGGRVLTRGDSCAHADSIESIDNVLGVAVAFESGGRVVLLVPTLGWGLLAFLQVVLRRCRALATSLVVTRREQG